MQSNASGPNFEDYHDNTKLTSDIGRFFVLKIERIRSQLDTAAASNSGSSLEAPCASPVQLASFTLLGFYPSTSLLLPFHIGST